MESERKYPAAAKDYKLYEEIGEGVSATVYRALCVPFNEVVAIKVLDLERCNSDLDGIRREVQTMNLIDHPNLLRAYCSFIAGYSLYVVMPYMAGGSCLHIMKSAFPEGFEEPVIATLLRETLKALVYLHSQGHIHRDVKAGNILVDSNGSVKLADFGVSACMFDTGDRRRSRNTFVGTPCWMAPEVMQQLHGYDFKADIWSFGITALELAHGHAPFSKYPPMKVLLMTLQNAPPGLDYDRDRRFSKSFKELISACLVKDPKKRPMAEKLLKHHFFKHARSHEYVARSILDGLPPLGERFKMLKEKEADLLVQNKALYGDKEQLSQQEYIRGISAWNFNLEDLKNQAALIQDDHGMPNAEHADTNVKQKEREWESYNNSAISNNKLPPARTNDSGSSPNRTDSIDEINDLESSLASFPIKPLQALKGCFDVVEDDTSASSPDRKGLGRTEEDPVPEKSSIDLESERIEGENVKQKSSLPRHIMTQHKKNLSGPLMADNMSSPKKITGEENRELLHQKYPQERNYSGPLSYRHKQETNNFSSVEDPSDGAVVKLKGRFKVTSGDVSPKGHTATNCYFNPVGGAANPSVSTSSVLSSLQSMLQQNTTQREEIVKLMKFLEQTSGKQMEPVELGPYEMFQVSPSSKEKGLQAMALNLHQSVKSLTDELQRLKLKNAELERLLNAKNQSSRYNEDGNVQVSCGGFFSPRI